MKIYDTNHSKKVICYFLDMLCCCKAAGMECDNDDVDDDDDDDELFFRNGWPKKLHEALFPTGTINRGIHHRKTFTYLLRARFKSGQNPVFRV